MSTPPYLDLPSCARARRIDTDRGPFAALLAEPEPGRAVRGTALLVPGFTGSKEDFIAVLGPLAADGWRVVALDLLGQHESPHATEPDRYDVHALAADVSAVVTALDAGPVHLVGHSFGGLVARAVALAEPAALVSLTLLCTGPAALPEQRRERVRRLITALDQLDLATIWATIVELDAESGIVLPPAPILAFLERRFLGNDAQALRRFGAALVGEPDRVADLAAVTSAAGLPVLVAHGAADDEWPPAEQRDMADRLGARYAVLTDGGHSPAAETPASTAALLAAFWAAAADRPGVRAAGPAAAR